MSFFILPFHCAFAQVESVIVLNHILCNMLVRQQELHVSFAGACTNTYLHLHVLIYAYLLTSLNNAESPRSDPVLYCTLCRLRRKLLLFSIPSTSCFMLEFSGSTSLAFPITLLSWIPGLPKE